MEKLTVVVLDVSRPPEMIEALKKRDETRAGINPRRKGHPSIASFRFHQVPAAFDKIIRGWVGRLQNVRY